MNNVMRQLLTLQTLEFDSPEKKLDEAQVKELREKIPQQILAHYDRLRARGKRGIAIVRNSVCTGCHMLLPVGVVTKLMHDNDIQLCDTCGRYLYLPEPAETQPVANVPATKTPAKPRKRKALDHAAI